MITEQRFEEIVNKVNAGEAISNEYAVELVQAMAELDQRGLVAEAIVQFVLQGAEQVYSEVAEEVIGSLNLRDHDKVKKLQSISRRASAQLVSITQMYIAQLYMQMEEALNEESAVADTDPDVLFDEDPA